MQGLDLKYEYLVDWMALECSRESAGVRERAFGPRFGNQMNFTELQHHTAYKYGGNMNGFYNHVENRFSENQCKSADCLHPCYGGGASICAICYQYWRGTTGMVEITSGLNKAEALPEICSACHVPVR